MRFFLYETSFEREFYDFTSITDVIKVTGQLE